MASFELKFQLKIIYTSTSTSMFQLELHIKFQSMLNCNCSTFNIMCKFIFDTDFGEVRMLYEHKTYN